DSKRRQRRARVLARGGAAPRKPRTRGGPFPTTRTITIHCIAQGADSIVGPKTRFRAGGCARPRDGHPCGRAANPNRIDSCACRDGSMAKFADSLDLNDPPIHEVQMRLLDQQAAAKLGDRQLFAGVSKSIATTAPGVPLHFDWQDDKKDLSLEVV